jgi:hypothetical protein
LPKDTENKHGKLATFRRFDLLTHARDVTVDGIDDALMTSLVSGDQAEVICIRKSDIEEFIVVSVLLVAVSFL